MSETRWVCHISGQGEKWRLQPQYEHNGNYWIVFNITSEYRNALHLPKSEYRLCTPPERWEDVTEQIELQGNTHCWDPIEKMSWLALPSDRHGYRLRKVQLFEKKCDSPSVYMQVSAFIVEKKVTQ